MSFFREAARALLVAARARTTRALERSFEEISATARRFIKRTADAPQTVESHEQSDGLAHLFGRVGFFKTGSLRYFNRRNFPGARREFSDRMERAVMPRSRSKMMDELYGVRVAQNVFDRLEYLDPSPDGLNDQIQEIAYNYYWAKPGLSTKDKSLVTITALMVTHKEEQTRIHLNGFLNAGGTVDEVLAVLVYLGKKIGEASSQKGLEALKEVLKDREGLEDFSELTAKYEKDFVEEKKDSLLTHDFDIVEIASAVASGNLQNIDAAISTYIDKHDGKFDEVKNIMYHLIVYCGFPTAMNGFARLREVLKLKNIQEPVARARL